MKKLLPVRIQKGNAGLALGLLGGGDGPREINTVCPAITPSLGAELIPNGTFDANTTGWIVSQSAIASVAGGQSGNALQVTNSAAAYGWARPDPLIAATIGEFYQVSRYHKNGTAAGHLKIGSTSGGSELYSRDVNNAAWTQSLVTFRSTAAALSFRFGLESNTSGQTALFDELTFRKLLFASTLTYLGRRSGRPGTYRCAPTISVDTQAGLVLGYTDESNLIKVVVDRVDNKAKLLKRIGGTWTEVIGAVVTYDAAKELKVVIAANGSAYSLYYDGVQVGVTTAINDAGLGTRVYGFSTLAANTVGLVTTNP
jgi:hypothetical protein